MNDLEEIFAPPPEVAAATAETVAAVAREYLRVRARKEACERELSTLSQLVIDREVALLAKLDEHGLNSIKILDDNGKPAHVIGATSTSYRLNAEHELDEIRAWIIEHGGSPLIKEGVYWQSLESFCRELAEQGESIPAAITVTDRRVIRVKRG